MNDNHYLPYIREDHEDLAPIYLEDLDAILPVVIKVNRKYKISADREEITSIDIYSSMEAATSTDYKTQAAGILCECYMLEDLPASTVERIEAAIEAKAELARRHRETDNELAEMCRSILMAGMALHLASGSHEDFNEGTTKLLQASAQDLVKRIEGTP